jgi:hypothetical protein
MYFVGCAFAAGVFIKPTVIDATRCMNVGLAEVEPAPPKLSGAGPF